MKLPDIEQAMRTNLRGISIHLQLRFDAEAHSVEWVNMHPAINPGIDTTMLLIEIAQALAVQPEAIVQSGVHTLMVAELDEQHGSLGAFVYTPANTPEATDTYWKHLGGASVRLLRTLYEDLFYARYTYWMSPDILIRWFVQLITARFLTRFWRAGASADFPFPRLAPQVSPSLFGTAARDKTATSSHDRLLEAMSTFLKPIVWVRSRELPDTSPLTLVAPPGSNVFSNGVREVMQREAEVVYARHRKLIERWARDNMCNILVQTPFRELLPLPEPDDRPR